MTFALELLQVPSLGNATRVRSAACSMRAIGDILDRGTTLALLRSQKDALLSYRVCSMHAACAGSVQQDTAACATGSGISSEADRGQRRRCNLDVLGDARFRYHREPIRCCWLMQKVRRSAVHTVSLFSLYVDDDVFIKVCRGLPPLAKGPVQTAAIRLQARMLEVLQCRPVKQHKLRVEGCACKGQSPISLDLRWVQIPGA